MDPNFKWTTRDEKLKVVAYWWERQQGLCCICGEAMEPYHRDAGKNPAAASIEHLIPKRDKGPDTVGNVRLAHRSCNNHAGGKWAEEQQRKLVEAGLVPSKKKRARRAAYVYDARTAQPQATGRPLEKLRKIGVDWCAENALSLPRGATLLPEYLDKIVATGPNARVRMNAKAAADQNRIPRPKLTAIETAQWLKQKGVRGA